MQNFLSLWLNTGAQITHGGQVQRPRQKKNHLILFVVAQFAWTAQGRVHLLLAFLKKMRDLQING